jgi:hypothetical protein
MTKPLTVPNVNSVAVEKSGSRFLPKGNLGMFREGTYSDNDKNLTFLKDGSMLCEEGGS